MNSRGSSLVSVLILSLVASAVMISLVFLMGHYSKMNKQASTEETLNVAFEALAEFYQKNGYYPCPASLTAPYEDSLFGKSKSSCGLDSDGVDFYETTDSDGVDRKIAVGAIPSRSLNISDKHSFDYNKNRLVYAISTSYTAPHSPSNTQTASIQLVDRNNDNITSEYVIFHLIYFGEEDQGAYGFEGNQIAACDPNSYFGENCDGDNVFTHSAKKIDFGSDQYIAKVRFKSENPCRLDSEDNPPPQKTAVLLDTSGSMNWPAPCPPNTSNEECSRMQTALWAVHHALDSRMMQTANNPDAFTGFSGFKSGSVSSIKNSMSKNLQLNSQEDIYDMYTICPVGGSPLGDNLYAMAQIIGNGTESNPNSITLVTDIKQNDKVYGSLSPAKALELIKEDYPFLKINVVDALGTNNNTLLKKIAEETGGTYNSAKQPDAFLKATLASIGACVDTNLPDVPEYETCDPIGELPTNPTPPTDPPVAPPPAPKPKVTVTAYIEILIGNANSITVSGFSKDEIYKNLMNALKEANETANQELSLALSVALSDALAAHKEGLSVNQVAGDIKDAFAVQMQVAAETAIEDAQVKINTMPKKLRPKINSAVGQAVTQVMGQLNDQLDPYIETLVEDGTMPQIMIVTDPIYIK